MSQRYLITGGAGFIGYHLCQFLLKAGHEVVAIDNFARGKKDPDFVRLLNHINFIEADLSRGMPSSLAGEFDGFFHLAGVVGVDDVLKNPFDVFETNVRILFETLGWLRKSKVKRFLYVSSSEVYGWGPGTISLPVPTPEDVPLLVPPRSKFRGGYALSKINGEALTEMVCREINLPFCIVRPHNVYGPRMGNSHVIPQLWKRIKNSQKNLNIRNPSHTRAFCFVEDAVDQMFESIGHANLDVDNIGNDREEVSIGELAKEMCSIMNKELHFVHELDPRDPFARRCPDMSKRLQQFGEKPLISLSTGLSRSLEWYEKNKEFL